ncbi:MAG: hypothetical protein ICV68_02960, partial [Pyrinomonadaceae bacterium]|nr:hypothetical protein [Pyrinomonadaceae bacterium]
MRKDVRQSVRLGQRSVRFTEEAKGVVAVPLFQPRSCRAMIEAVREDENWRSAMVSRRTTDGELRSVVDPSHRIADVLYSQHLSAV